MTGFAVPSADSLADSSSSARAWTALPVTIFLDQATLDLDDKDAAGGICDNKVGLGVAASRAADPQRMPGIPPFRKPARHRILDRTFPVRFRASRGRCGIQTRFHHTVILSAGLRRAVRDRPDRAKSQFIRRLRCRPPCKVGVACPEVESAGIIPASRVTQ